MNHPHLNKYQAMKVSDNEEARLRFERGLNLLRLIAYNNKRIKRGLRPVDYPESLTPAWKPTHRDGEWITTR